MVAAVAAALVTPGCSSGGGVRARTPVTVTVEGATAVASPDLVLVQSSAVIAVLVDEIGFFEPDVSGRP